MSERGRMLGRIYLITNAVNGKKYVGQTIKPVEKRLKEHFKAAFSENRQAVICHAIRKYGRDSFSVICLQDDVAIEDLDAAEQYWVAFYDTFSENGYNATTGGNQCRISDETKAKISAALMGKPRSEETKKKMSESQKGVRVGTLNFFYGRTHSKETIEQIKETLKGQMDGKNNPFYGKRHSEESLKKMSESHIGKQAGEKHPRSKLTEKDVLEIRELIENGVNRNDLAKQYCVSKGAIAKIASRENWSHI